MSGKGGSKSGVRTVYSSRLAEEKKSIIESFLKDYIYGGDGEFMPNVQEIEYSSHETYQGEVRNKLKHGTGIFEDKSGHIYLGEWE